MNHVVIACSYKFEDVNTILELFKLNYKNPPFIHLFCNLNSKDFAKYSNILRSDLIDDLHHIPEEKCYVSNADRDAKRRQPLEMFQKITEYMNKIQKNFAFLEGDNYPLSEESFYKPLQDLKENDFIANMFYFDRVDTSRIIRKDHINVIKSAASQVHKMPYGFILPASTFVGYVAAGKISDFINQNYSNLLDGKKNFEGCLGEICAKTDINRKNVSDYFCYTYPHLTQIDPVSYVLHHHNILNLKKIFVKYGITKGDTIKMIFEKKSYTKIVENIELQYQDLEFEICSLHIKHHIESNDI